MQFVVEYILQRLSERSTWVGITGVASVLGVVFSPEHAAAVATVGATVASIIQVVVKDHKPASVAAEASADTDAAVETGGA